MKTRRRFLAHFHHMLKPVFSSESSCSPAILTCPSELVRCPEAAGYHWHPPLNLEQVPELVRKERERAKMGLVFYRKHPTRRVRFIIQFTIWHRLLWELLTLGGLLNERSLRPVLAWLIRRGHPGVAMELLRLPLNRISVVAMQREAQAAGIA